ncbi:MAG: ABC transporter permease subunit [Synechococcaceae cyanobacterium RL_1_2]|nr:ABC transporter permease subunit [Synechococcaceae cyanobacterium RL_1_2]
MLSPLWISLKTTCLATAIVFCLGLAIASIMFSYKGRGKHLIDSILTLPIVLPPSVMGFLLLFGFGMASPLGRLLNQWGLNPIFTWSGTVIAATIIALPLMYRCSIGAFNQVDQDLLDCARTLGAKEGQIFREILLPLAGQGF